METAGFVDAELERSWIEGEPGASWRTASGTAGEASGSSLLEIEPGCRLPTHTDSAEETIVVISGSAEVSLNTEAKVLDAGELAIVPTDEPHSVACGSSEPLRFVALYASSDVVTTYKDEVQPDGERSRRPFG